MLWIIDKVKAVIAADPTVKGVTLNSKELYKSFWSFPRYPDEASSKLPPSENGVTVAANPPIIIQTAMMAGLQPVVAYRAGNVVKNSGAITPIVEEKIDIQPHSKAIVTGMIGHGT